MISLRRIQMFLLTYLLTYTYNDRDQQKVVYGLLNGAIFNDLERPVTQLSSKQASIFIRPINEHTYNVDDSNAQRQAAIPQGPTLLAALRKKILN